MRRLLFVSFLLAGISLVAPSQPGYDPWAWLLWGREVMDLDLDTADGPAFKPLPVAISALLSLAGDGAPALWLLVARTGAIAAVLLAGRVAFRMSDGAWVAAAVASAGVALSAGWWWHGAVGNGEGLFLALTLAAADQALGGRHRPALAIGVLAALLRPESWPFLAAYGLWLWRSEPRLRPWLAAAAAVVPALWLMPEWWGSGNPFRSSDRARIPNPGAPATDSFPAWASLRAAFGIPLLPVLGLALLSPRRVVPIAAAAWIGLVAAMAELGYSGEARYALPGAALLSVAAGLGATRLPRRRLAAVAIAAVPFVVVRAGAIGGELGRAGDDAVLWSSLPPALDAAGGIQGALRCGHPATGRYRGTGVAYALGLHKNQVRSDGAAGQGLVLGSRIRPGTTISPRAEDGSEVLARSARWVLRCDVRTP